MKNIIFLLLLTFSFTLTLKVNAATIDSTSYDNSAITIKGTGKGQIQIVLFDSKNEPVYMTTYNSTDENFSVTLPKIESLSSGKYKVKVADYKGENVDDKEVIVNTNVESTSIETTKANNPKTGDNIIKYIIFISLSIVGLIATIKLYRKAN